MQYKASWIVCFLGTIFPSFAQISPPGLGVAAAAQWTALGLREDLDSAGKWQSVTYMGVGRLSHTEVLQPFQKQAILVLNEEVYHQFHPTWQYSVAISYRKQHEYETYPPYELSDPPFQQEFRGYGRLTHVWKSKRLKFASTFRQEIRRFYEPDFDKAEEDLQFRSRLRSHITFYVDRAKVHRFILSMESLFAIGRKKSPNLHWNEFSYRESRVCAYYAWAPPHLAMVVNIGYMNNLIGADRPVDVHYVCMDVTWENPFKKLKQKISRLPAGLE